MIGGGRTNPEMGLSASGGRDKRNIGPNEVAVQQEEVAVEAAAAALRSSFAAPNNSGRRPPFGFRGFAEATVDVVGRIR